MDLHRQVSLELRSIVVVSSHQDSRDSELLLIHPLSAGQLSEFFYGLDATGKPARKEEF